MEPECKQHDLKYHCGSLEAMFNFLKDKSKSVDVSIDPGNYILASSFSLTGLCSIRIRSSNQINIANLSCTPNFDSDPDIDTGIEFSHGFNLIFEHVNIRWCGMKHISTSQEHNDTCWFVS